MQKINCQTCGVQTPLGDMFRVNAQTLCEPCANKAVAHLKANSLEMRVAHEVDPTICGKCATDFGSGALPLVGGAPFCGPCAETLYNRPFPGWLKMSLAFLLAVLVIALWHGIPYFKAGRHLVLAERAMDRKDYKQATLQFDEVFKAQATDQKVLLLAAKAYILNGDIAKAQAIFKLRSNYDSDDLSSEVNGLWERALGAYKKAADAAKLEEEKHFDEAAERMREASHDYPESSDLASAADGYAAGAAFERKDYDAFLTYSNAAMAKAPDSANAVASVASAFAAKYAVTGDPALRSHAEELLAKAKTLAHTPQEIASYNEYAERIQYRLDSRQIIDKPEYDLRFRQKKGKP